MSRSRPSRPAEKKTVLLGAASAVALLIFVPFWAAFTAAPARAESDYVKVENFPTHSRLVIRLDESIPAELKTVPGGFQIFLRDIGLGDLGAPLANEEEWRAQFNRVTGPRLQSLTFSEEAGGVKVEGKWRFPSGADALADPRMEAFDYRDKTPAQYVLDFWPKKGPTVASINLSKQRAALARERQEEASAAKVRRDRRLASEKARAEAYDIGRFCRDPLSEHSDVFLKLLPVHERVEFSHWIPATTPDSDFPYFEPEASDQDKSAQYVRLALSLYRQGKPALVIRTVDFFDAEQPQSRFREEMKFLRANALLKLGHSASAVEILKQITSESRESPEALYSAMYLAVRMYAEHNDLAAFETFSWLFTQHPEHRLAWVFHLGAAESLAGLKQTERAAKEYQWVVENGGDTRTKAEAAARAGDLYLARFDYERALAEYSTAQTHFPEDIKAFPSVAINRAEALYQLGVAEREEGILNPDEQKFLPRSEEAFNSFLKDYPTHPAGWRAAYRLGELEGRSIESPHAEATRKWFYETVNRFPFSPGATLARLRLIPCGDHGGFTPESARKFFDQEAKNFTGRGELPETGFREYRALAHVRALLSWDQEDAAVSLLTDELKANPVSKARPALERMYAVLFRKRIIGMIAEGKKYEALAFYDARKSFLPKQTRGFDPDYLLKLSQAASDLGFARVAEELNSSYRNLVAAAQAPNGRAPAANAPTQAQDLYDRLQASEPSFAEAKALWVASLTERATPGRDKKPSIELYAHVRGLLAKVAEESPFSYPRELILGMMEEREGRPGLALEHALRAQVLRPAGLPSERLDAWIASLQARAGDRQAALEGYRALEKRLPTESAAPDARETKSTTKIKSPSRAMASAFETSRDPAAVLGVPARPTREELVLAEADLLEKLGRWGDAAAEYSRAVDAGMGGDQARYGYAHALLQTRDTASRARARDVLEKLLKDSPASGDASWKDLARETLAHLSKQD